MLLLLKLIDGTEIIGDGVNKGDKYIMSNPLQINYFVKTPVSIPTVALHRYMPFADPREFIFYSDQVITAKEPTTGMQAFYNATIKDVCENVDPFLNETLMEKAGQIAEVSTSTSNDVATAMLERLVVKPTLN